MAGSTRGSGTRSVAGSLADAVRSTPRSGRSRLVSALVRKRAGAIGLAIVLLNIAVAFAAPVLAPHDPLDQDVARRLLPPAWLAGGSPEYLLGTDQLGRDILSRIIYGSRLSLPIRLPFLVLSPPLSLCLS